MTNKIIPAILTQDKNDLVKKMQAVSGLVDWVHIDIMDGLFVDNTSVGLEDLAGIEPQLNIGVHLMVNKPEVYFVQCQEMGIRRVIFHAEASEDYEDLLDRLKHLGLEAGIAISPATPVSVVMPLLDRLNVVMVMGVVPGRGGQDFIESSLDKVTQLQQAAPDVEIIVDGGIGFDNIDKLKEVGADSFVVGSTIFDSDDVPDTIKKLQEMVK